MMEWKQTISAGLLLFLSFSYVSSNDICMYVTVDPRAKVNCRCKGCLDEIALSDKVADCASLKMKYERTKDPEYPRVYDTWTTERGQLMVIQDLCSEDDSVVLELMEKNMITDEPLGSIQKLKDDPLSVREMLAFWADCLKQRMSLGCYEVKDGQKYLVALNLCVVGRKGDHKYDFKGKAGKAVFSALEYAEHKCDAFEFMGLDKIMYAMGLCVRREYRGMQLGQKILNAREPLCISQGIEGTATVFTGIASQKSAERCGFKTIVDIPIKELTEAGLPYPADEERRLKYMIKTYK